MTCESLLQTKDWQFPFCLQKIQNMSLLHHFGKLEKDFGGWTGDPAADWTFSDQPNTSNLFPALYALHSGPQKVGPDQVSSIHLILSSHAQGNIFPFFNCFHSKCDWKPWITLGAIRGYKREYKWRRCSFLEIHSCTNYNYTGQTHVLLDEIPCIIRQIFIIANRHVVETRDCLFIR